MGACFFIFGFITWINGTLIPICRLPANWKNGRLTWLLLHFMFLYCYGNAFKQDIAMVGNGKGMSIGLIVMAVGCMIFIPAAFHVRIVFVRFIFRWSRINPAQTAVNPYILCWAARNCC
jgi:fucose permease